MDGQRGVNTKGRPPPFWFSAAAAASTHPSLLRRIQEAPWRGGLEPADDVQGLEATILEGRIPRDLRGTLYRNGPGRIRVAAEPYGHWFDGDGYVTALEVDGEANTAHFSGRFVRTARFEAQEKAAAGLGPGAGVAQPGAWTPAGSTNDSTPTRIMKNLFRLPTNPANTNVVAYAGKLLALCEGGAPVELDPNDLSTKGEFDFGGAIRSFVAAHSRVDLSTGHMNGFGLIFGPGLPKLNCFEADRDGRVLQQKAHTLPYHTFVHDMVGLHHLCISLIG